MVGKIAGFILLCVSCSLAGGDALYKQGSSLFKTDPSLALELFEQAAEAGNVSAMAGAGHCYENGTGTAIDYAKAIEWYEKAVAENSLKACEGLARIYASCPDPEFHDGEKSVKFATPVVRKKPRDAEALALLAAAYARNCEFKKAIEIATKASRNASDVAAAKKMRARLDCLKAGEPEPVVATEVWYFRAAEKNSTWAMVEMAGRYADREGALYDAGSAILMCRKSIDAGRIDLLYLLGNVYFYAENETMDLDKAQECYDRIIKESSIRKGRRSRLKYGGGRA